MTTNVYLKYEEVKELLNLLPENENDDRITVLFCNSIVTSILNASGKTIEKQDKKIMGKMVLTVFKKIKEMDCVKENIQNGTANITNLTDIQMLKLFDAVQETLEMM